MTWCDDHDPWRYTEQPARGALHVGALSDEQVDRAVIEYARWPYRASTDRRAAMRAAIAAALRSEFQVLDVRHYVTNLTTDARAGGHLLEQLDAGEECIHGRLPFDPTPECGCWGRRRRARRRRAAKRKAA